MDLIKHNQIKVISLQKKKFGPHPVSSRMSLSVFSLSNSTVIAGYERLSLAFLCRSLPGPDRLTSCDWLLHTIYFIYAN